MSIILTMMIGGWAIIMSFYDDGFLFGPRLTILMFVSLLVVVIVIEIRNLK